MLFRSIRAISRTYQVRIGGASEESRILPHPIIYKVYYPVILIFYGSPTQKNTAYAFVHTGVWHNPRIKKQKQYIPKYALTHCQSNSLFISCQTYVCTDWFVSKIYVRCSIATKLSADNCLQRYNIFLRYANFSLIFSTDAITLRKKQTKHF